MLDVNAALTSPWTVRLVMLGTIAVLVAFRRFQHLAAYLVIVLAAVLLLSAVTLDIGRMRPAGIQILGPWQGYSQPSRPVAALALALVGALYTLVPAGRWRNRGKWAAAIIVAALCAARLYLAVDHPTDQLTALIIAWPLAVVAFWLAVPNDVFPISYRGGRKAHLDIGGRRGAAIVTALDHQLGLAVTGVEPFGLEASAGSTPLRVRGPRPRRHRDRSCSASSTRSATSGPTAGTSGSGPSSTGGSKTRSRSPRCAGWSSTRITCCA